MFDDDIPQALYDWLVKQNTAKLVEILCEALQVMQQYNGRTLMFCICTAAGFKQKEKDGKTVWTMPEGGKEDVKTGKAVTSTVRPEPVANPEMDSPEIILGKLGSSLINQSGLLRNTRIIDAFEVSRDMLQYVGQQQSHRRLYNEAMEKYNESGTNDRQGSGTDDKPKRDKGSRVRRSSTRRSKA